MEFIIGFIIVLIQTTFISFGSSMIILSLTCGMPLLKRAKNEGIVFKNAPNKYIVPIIIWSVILIGTEFILFLLLKKYYVYLIIGIIFGLLNGCKALVNKNNPSNIQDFLDLYKNYLVNQISYSQRSDKQ